MKKYITNEIDSVSATCPVSELSKRNIRKIILARVNYRHPLSVNNILNVFNNLNTDTASPPTGEDTECRYLSPGEAGKR